MLRGYLTLTFITDFLPRLERRFGDFGDLYCLQTSNGYLAELPLRHFFSECFLSFLLFRSFVLFYFLFILLFTIKWIFLLAKSFLPSFLSLFYFLFFFLGCVVAVVVVVGGQGVAVGDTIIPTTEML